MVIDEIVLLAYLSLPVGVLIWSYRRPGPDAGVRLTVNDAQDRGCPGSR